MRAASCEFGGEGEGGREGVFLDLRAESESEDQRALAAQRLPLRSRRSRTFAGCWSLRARPSSASGARTPNFALLEEEVRIDRRAVSADSDSGLQEVRFAVVVGGLEDGREVNPGGFAVPREFVGEGDVHVAIDHPGELDHLGGLERADVDDRRAEVLSIERRRARGRFGREAADDLRVLRQAAG